MAPKISIAKTSTDADVLEKSREDPNGKDCNTIEWVTPTNNIRIWPPEGTTALVVDVDAGGGAINIYETPRDKFVDGVGRKESGDLNIIPWKTNWWYYSIGSVRVGYISKKD